MHVEQIYTGCLAEATYYIVSNGEAAIIDPLRETQPYIDKLQQDGLRLKYIFETHFHADFVSGHIDLAKQTGATIVYGPDANPNYDVYMAKDGEVLTLGNVRFRVVHTPGHTLESTCYLLEDEAGNDHALFTGDTLFIGDVGRPDLAINRRMTKEDLAGMLFDSLRQKIMPLADTVIIYPAHGAGSACGKNMSRETFDTLGHQKEVNYALRSDMTRTEFIDEVLNGMPPPPSYFAQNARLNKEGYSGLENILKRGLTRLTSSAFEAMAKTKDALILDTRHQSAFKDGFIPGSMFIGIDGGFAPWVGTLIQDVHRPIVFIAEKGREEEVVVRLSRVGCDQTLGYLEGGIDAWRSSGRAVQRIETVSAAELANRLADGCPTIIDVRKRAEYVQQHIPRAENKPLSQVFDLMDEMDRREALHIHCAGGYRSVIFASILHAHGFEKPIDVHGGFKAIRQANIPLSEVCAC